MKITQHAAGDVAVVAPAGRLIAEDNETLRNALDTLVQQGRVKIVLDLRELTYVDSSGLGLMVSKCVSARRRGGDVKLLHPTARSQHLLDITHLSQVFDVFDSEADAIRAFGSSSFHAHPA